jgi:hypothetical protein
MIRISPLFARAGALAIIVRLSAAAEYTVIDLSHSHSGSPSTRFFRIRAGTAPDPETP